MKEIQKMLRDWSADRPVIEANNTPQRIIELLKGEVVEAEESLEDREHLASEIADILIFTLGLANLYGFDMDAEVREKIALNILRYPSSSFQDGDYESSRLNCKKKEKPIISEFYSI
jgi:hypothetical protein